MATGRLTFIRLDDASAWEALRPGQFVVFLAGARSEILLDRDGRTADHTTSVPLFDSLDDAERYAEKTVASMANVCGEIYDHHGRSGDPVKRVYPESLRRRFDPERSARRYAWAGGGLLCVFTIWAIVGANRSDLHFLWFYIIGMKLLTLGTILFVRGVGFFIGRRWQK